MAIAPMCMLYFQQVYAPEGSIIPMFFSTNCDDYFTEHCASKRSEEQLACLADGEAAWNRFPGDTRLRHLLTHPNPMAARALQSHLRLEDPPGGAACDVAATTWSEPSNYTKAAARLRDLAETAPTAVEASTALAIRELLCQRVDEGLCWDRPYSLAEENTQATMLVTAGLGGLVLQCCNGLRCPTAADDALQNLLDRAQVPDIDGRIAIDTLDHLAGVGSTWAQVGLLALAAGGNTMAEESRCVQDWRADEHSALQKATLSDLEAWKDDHPNEAGSHVFWALQDAGEAMPNASDRTPSQRYLQYLLINHRDQNDAFDVLQTIVRYAPNWMRRTRERAYDDAYRFARDAQQPAVWANYLNSMTQLAVVDPSAVLVLYNIVNAESALSPSIFDTLRAIWQQPVHWDEGPPTTAARSLLTTPRIVLE